MSENSPKCCFCIPLRGALFFLAYYNVVGEAFALALDFTGYAYFDISEWSLMDSLQKVSGFSSLGLEYLPYLVDLAYGAALLYALHKNDTMVLYIYVWYSMTYIVVVLYVGVIILWEQLIDGKLLLTVAVIVFYQGWIAFLVRKMRNVIIQNSADLANQDKMRYCTKQSTNDSDVESQPLPDVPASAPATSL